jgi:putative pre-16S rRNA nuclease
MPRILALDVGTRTFGIAVSDPLGFTAQGLRTLRRKNKRTDYGALGKLIQEYEVGEIVLGLPLHLSGDESAMSQRVTELAEELRAKFALPVHLWDERMSTAQASRVLRESEMSIKRRGEVVDQLAAVLILQSFIDARAGAQGRS